MLKQSSSAILFVIILMYGCAFQTPTPSSPSLPPPVQPGATLAIEAQAEAETLRAALATERIKTAKQAALVRSATQEAESLKARELEQVETISHLKTEMASIKEERDKLRLEVAQLRAKTASAPQVLQLVTQMRTMETSLNGLSSSLETLSEDIEHLRDEVEHQKMAGSSAGTTSGSLAGVPSKEMIVVKPGDSLWRLARTHGTTVEELKQLNGLTHNTIVVGQFLKIPLVDDLDAEELVELPNVKDKLTP